MGAFKSQVQKGILNANEKMPGQARHFYGRRAVGPTKYFSVDCGAPQGGLGRRLRCDGAQTRHRASLRARSFHGR